MQHYLSVFGLLLVAYGSAAPTLLPVLPNLEARTALPPRVPTRPMARLANLASTRSRRDTNTTSSTPKHGGFAYHHMYPTKGVPRCPLPATLKASITCLLAEAAALNRVASDTPSPFLWL